MAKYTVILKRSSEVGKQPQADSLEYGEVAINYAAGQEFLSIKNSENKIATLDLNDNVAKEAQSTLDEHIADMNNPHQITKEQVGLGNVDNTADADKPLSALAQQAISSKVDKSEIIDNLTSVDSDKPLSAKQGKTLAAQLSTITGGATDDLLALQNRVSAIEEEISTALSKCDEVEKNVDVLLSLVNKITV